MPSCIAMAAAGWEVSLKALGITGGAAGLL
jgi:hypothetical protein